MSDGCRLRRRDLLRLAETGACAALVAGLAGCGPGAAPKSSASPAVPLRLRVSPTVTAIPGLISAFNASQKAITLVPFASSGRPPRGLGRDLQIASLTQYELPRGSAPSFEPLDAALRLTNINLAALTSGTGRALQFGGQTYGLPLTQLPWGVRWRTDVFAAAGLAPPAADWTLAEFEAACERLQAFAASGKEPSIATALGPFRGEYGMPVGPLSTFWVPSVFEAAGLWQAFVVGFGGSAASGGRFTLTASQTVQGLRQLVDLARRFGSPAAKGFAPTPQQQGAVLSGCPSDGGNYGMWFAPYVPPLRFKTPLTPPPASCGQWQWARMPRFPAQPVIPTIVSGLGLEWQPPDVPGTKSPPRAPASAVTEYASATVAFLDWLYGDQAQTLLRQAGFIPVSSAADVQGPFWATAAPDIRALGDYAHFQDYAAGWPAVPPTDYVGQALEQALTQPGQLNALLTAAEQKLNSWLTQQEHAASPVGA